MDDIEIGKAKLRANLPGWPPRVRLSPSSLSLLGANAVTILVALWQKWPVSDVMWVYWGQSLVIGLFQALRMLTLRDFSTQGVTVNDHPVDATPATKVQMAGFFVVHYGFFHFVYMLFLTSDLGRPASGLPLLGLCLGAFFVNHAFSFAHNYELDRARKPNIGAVMLFPYARILPMHLTIIFGSLLARSQATLVLFLVLKTFADLIMHAVEHAEDRLPQAQKTEEV